MKKIIPILIVGLFVFSGLGAVALPVDEQKVADIMLRWLHFLQ